MDPSNVNEVLSALLLLPQNRLLAGGDKMSLYGHTLLTILTKKIFNACSGNTTLPLSQAHLQSLATLYSSCYSIQLDDVFLQVCVAKLKLKQMKLMVVIHSLVSTMGKNSKEVVESKKLNVL